MGHSGGTYLGIQVASRYPELYSAYIGQAQFIYKIESKKWVLEFILQEFQALGDTTMAQKLTAAPVTLESGTPKAYLAVRDTAMHRLVIGTTRKMSYILMCIFLPLCTLREYTLREKLNHWHCKIRNDDSVFREMSL